MWLWKMLQLMQMKKFSTSQKVCKQVTSM
jgi:hypothetical protein